MIRHLTSSIAPLSSLLFSPRSRLALPSFSARANTHRPSVCCIKFDIPALSPPTTPQFSLLGKLFIRGRLGGGGRRVADGGDGRGFSQCRFHAEKWGICHHLEVDSGNGTATTRRGFLREWKEREDGRGRARKGAGGRLAKRNKRKWRTNVVTTEKKAVLTRDSGHAGRALNEVG